MSRPNFSARSQESEIMDDLEASQGDTVYQTLRELATINQLLGGNAITLKGLDAFAKGWDANRTLRIADLGCGGGDMLILMDQWAKKRGITVELIGIDFNPDIVAYAQKNTIDFTNISYQALDVFSAEFAAQEYDIVVCSLFLHHFPDATLSTLLAQLVQQTTLGVVINDLHRHPLAYYSIKWLTAGFSKSSMVKYDAPLSVLRAFSAQEWRNILQQARIVSYSMQWRWAFRWKILLPGQAAL